MAENKIYVKTRDYTELTILVIWSKDDNTAIHQTPLHKAKTTSFVNFQRDKETK